MIARHSPATPINIAYVVAACAVLNKASPEYDVFRKQCYWYAGLAFRLLVGDDVMRQLQYNGPQRAGEVANFFSVMKEPELDRHARELRPLYEDKLQAIQHEVTERRRKERRAEDAEREAEGARRDAEGARRDAEGARREAEGARREAEGARREAEAAVRRAAEMEIELQKLKELNQGARTSAASVRISSPIFPLLPSSDSNFSFRDQARRPYRPVAPSTKEPACTSPSMSDLLLS
ncbi:hypothetical protein DAEQUDRAFT_606502 [Daedalea quercina L-15889]|uniref:Uncharacterized protein n=1 Tax=Daedalea quercina L-15889 TaxID=1314783 RepID=A0A165LIY9_9APHY|nr:hypothetical protein DAEQUDRAFT_606502 [Daedalea quercina L-15889]